MGIVNHGAFGINYAEYRFGSTRQFFRGPKPYLSHAYVSIIGGGETFGRFVQHPYAEILGAELPLETVNFGLTSAGPTFYLRDTVLLETCNRSKLCIISVPHGYALSNRLYTVIDRSNAELKAVSETLQLLYPQVDFGSFRSVQSMLQRLQNINSANFKIVTIELRRAWVARMRELLGAISAPKLLVWISDRSPDESGFDCATVGIGPRMVDRAMLEDLQGYVDEYVEYVAPADCLNLDGSDRIFGEGERELALRFPGGDIHLEVAETLYPVVKTLLRSRAPHRVALRKTLNLLGF